MPITINRTISVYSIIALVAGANGGILIFVHNFGNANVDVVAGSILAGLAFLSIVAHAFLTAWVIDIPATVYTELQGLDTAVVAVLTAGGMIVQYSGTVSAALTPLVSLILQGVALLGSLLAGFFEATTAKRLAAAAKA